MENAPCAIDNASCTSGLGCTDICKPCQLLVCHSNRWERHEAAPAPCFSCGSDLQCQIHNAYCRTESGGPAGNPTTYGCVALPPACISTVTCACLSEYVAGSCTQASGGGLTSSLEHP